MRTGNANDLTQSVKSARILNVNNININNKNII